MVPEQAGWCPVITRDHDQRNHRSDRPAGATSASLALTGDAQRRPRRHGTRLALSRSSLCRVGSEERPGGSESRQLPRPECDHPAQAGGCRSLLRTQSTGRPAPGREHADSWRQRRLARSQHRCRRFSGASAGHSRGMAGGNRTRAGLRRQCPCRGGRSTATSTGCHPRGRTTGGSPGDLSEGSARSQRRACSAPVRPPPEDHSNCACPVPGLPRGEHHSTGDGGSPGRTVHAAGSGALDRSQGLHNPLRPHLHTPADALVEAGCGTWMPHDRWPGDACAAGRSIPASLERPHGGSCRRDAPGSAPEPQFS